MDIPVVLDTDIGTDVDDALALAFALASPEIRLLGITIVDANVDKRARIAARLLGLAGHPEIPIYKGISEPLGPGRGPTWMGHEGKGLLEFPFDGEEATISETPAVDWLIEQSKRESFHLVAIGPFTNVAAAVQKDPLFAKRLLHLTVMGGMVHQDSFLPEWKQWFKDHNMHPAFVDHNTASDPNAALIVSQAGCSMTWVTAELTFCTPLKNSCIPLLEETGSPFGEALARLLQIWANGNFRRRGFPYPSNAVACLHDPMALSSVVPHKWLELKEHHLAFSIEGGLFRIFEVKKHLSQAVHDISTFIDPERFESYFIQRVENFLRKHE